MSKMIPLSMPSIRGNEWKYVKECLDREWVSSAGDYVNRFEDDICVFTGAKFAVACVNGTAGLQIALQLVGVKPGDEVLVPTLTFIAPVNTIKYVGAEPVFMDCDRYYNIDIEKTIRFIQQETVFKDGFTINKLTKKRITAIIPVHIFGNPCNLDNLIHFCQERNIKVVEDATESLGSSYTKGLYANKQTGTVGDIGVYSFNGNKIITTGGGGMIVSNNKNYADKAKYITTQAKDDSINFIHNEVGYNYRLTNIQAAMGVAQLEMLPEYIGIKKKNYRIYKDNIDKIKGLIIADTPDYAESNKWFYCLQINKNQYQQDKDGVMAFLTDNQIDTRPIWYLNHLQKPYQSCQHYKIEKAHELLKSTLNLPCSTGLTEHQVKTVIQALRNLASD